MVCLPAPLTDWPNHIARVWIGVQLLRGDPFWKQFYALNPRPVPNLALDVGIGALHYAGLNVDIAAAAFLVLAFVVFVYCFCRFARAVGAGGDSKPMLGAILFLTGPVMYGLVNYVLGIGLAMGAVSHWIADTTRSSHRWGIAIGATVLLFPVHLLASGLFIVMIGGIDAWTLWRTATRSRGVILRASSSLGAGVTFVALLLASPGGGGNLPHSDGSNLWFPGHGHLVATIVWKCGLFIRMFADHATLAAALVTLLGGLVVAACVAFRPGARIPSLPVRGAVWFVVGALMVMVMILPDSVGAGSLLDYRIALMPLAIGAATLDLERHGTARALAFAAIAAVCLGRNLAFAADFQTESAAFRTIEAAAAGLPPGGIMLSARGVADEDIPARQWWSPPLEHGASRAVFAMQFVPTVFAVASQQPVVLKPEFDRWRRSWRIADVAEAEAFAHDAAALCVPGLTWPHTVTLFAAYLPEDETVMAADVARGPNWLMLDACRLVRRYE